MISKMSLENILVRLGNAFPDLDAREDLKRRTHQEWVEARLHLPRLVPSNVVRELPLVLAEMAKTVECSYPGENGDMVIYFLDVWAESFNPYEPSTREIVEKFADEIIGGNAGERFKAMMLSDLPGSKEYTSDERSAKDQASRAASFQEFTLSQNAAIYAWLTYVEPFYRQLGAVHDDLLRALIYWRLRSHKG